MERTAEEWGRVAVALPGWRWMPGMAYVYADDSKEYGWTDDCPDVDGGGTFWVEHDATRYAAWKMPPVVAQFSDGWAYFASPVLRGARLQDCQGEVFNPFGLGHADDPGCIEQNTPGSFSDPDDPATAGCLLALLSGPIRHSFTAEWHDGAETLIGDRLSVAQDHTGASWVVMVHADVGYAIVGHQLAKSASLGRACIAAAEAIGRWPGGVS